MTSRNLPAGTFVLAIVLALGVSAMPAWLIPLRAQSAEEAPPEAAEEAAPEAAPDAEDPAPSAKEIKQRAKEARIQEYLRKKEERRARKEAGDTKIQDQHDVEAAAELEQQQLAQPAVEEAPEPEAAPPVQEVPIVREQAPAVDLAPPPAQSVRPMRKQTSLPRDLARAQANVRALPLGQDPTVQTYLDRIDQQNASPGQLAAFGSFLAQNGLLRDALVYYGVALQLERRDPVLWVNVGTLHRQLKQTSAARSAYQRALALDPNNAFAHYNLGAVLDDAGKYDGAIAEYRAALELDPSLGDPVQNPQAANNNLLAAVKLMRYHEQIGSLGLPLIEIPAEPGQGTRATDEE